MRLVGGIKWKGEMEIRMHWDAKLCFKPNRWDIITYIYGDIIDENFDNKTSRLLINIGCVKEMFSNV